MGATFSVSLAQRATMVLINRAGLGKALDMNGFSRELDGGMGTQTSYIYNCNSIETNADGVNEATR